jgi:hypothetical protein
LQQFRTSESERCEQHTVVQRATLAHILLTIDQPELLRNSFKQLTATGTNYGILCMHDNDQIDCCPFRAKETERFCV